MMTAAGTTETPVWEAVVGASVWVIRTFGLPVIFAYLGFKLWWLYARGLMWVYQGIMGWVHSLT